jgi:hypothetical protein
LQNPPLPALHAPRTGQSARTGRLTQTAAGRILSFSTRMPVSTNCANRREIWSQSLTPPAETADGERR